MANYVIPITDASNENSNVELPVADNIADVDLTELFDAVDGITLGNLGQSTLNIATPKDAGPGGTPADAFATRKGRWMVRYHDAVSLRKSRFNIIAPDLNLLAPGTDFMNIAAGAGAALVAALNAEGQGIDGNGMVVDNVEFRGSNVKSKKS